MDTKYHIKRTGHLIDVGGGYCESECLIIETDSQKVMTDPIPHRIAKQLVRHLNQGGGFAGSTPDFFAQTFN